MGNSEGRQDRLDAVGIEKRHQRAKQAEADPFGEQAGFRQARALEQVETGEERDNEAEGEGRVKVGP